ncbi:hypothetical protein [Ulvibacterium sp.]|uniref:hypothetical protein n=1 Tax=Ulvibacterium sp. TaxID=2665914 RepID=UPI003BABEB9F
MTVHEQSIQKTSCKVRQVNIRAIDGEFSFNQVPNKAVLLGFLSELLEYFEREKNWKDGAYIESSKDTD